MQPLGRKVREEVVLDVAVESAADCAHDRTAQDEVLAGLDLESQPVLSNCRAADCVVLVTNHSTFAYSAIAKESKLIVDTRNAFRDFHSDKIVRL